MAGLKTGGVNCYPCVALALLLSLPALAWSDVSFERTVSVKASGPMAGMNSKIRIRTQISGDRSRTELLPGDDMAADLNVADVRVVRLDQNAIYHLRPDLQTFRKTSVDDMAAQLAQLRAQTNAAAGGQALPFVTEDCEWSEARFSAKKTKERERIASKLATRHILSMEQSCTVQALDQSCDVEWIMEPWMASRLPGYDEVSEFYQDYADRMDMDFLIPQMHGDSQRLLALFPNRWETLMDEMEEFDGYPVRTVMTLKIGGRACFPQDGKAGTDEDDVWAAAANSAYDKAIDRSGRETGKAARDASQGAMGDSVVGSIGGAAVGAATSELIGGMTGMFKKDEPARSKSSTTRNSRRSSRDGLTVFRINSEITDWSGRSVPEEQYEIPTSWKLQP